MSTNTKRSTVRVITFQPGQERFYEEFRVRLAVFAGSKDLVQLILNDAPVPIPDRQWFVFLVFQGKALDLIHPRGVPLDQKLVERSHEYAARMCALRFGLRKPCFIHTVPLLHQYAHWRRGLNAAIDRSNARIGDRRDWHLARMARECMTGFGLKYDFDQISRITTSAALNLEVIASTRGLPTHFGPELLHLGLGQLKGWNPGLVVTEDGRLELGVRQFQEGLRKAFGVKRNRSEAEVTPASLDAVGESPDFKRPSGIDPVEIEDAVDAAMTVEWIRSAVRSEQALHKPGSVKHAVADHVIPFLAEETGLAEVVAKLGRSESAVWKALEHYQGVLKKLRRE